MSFEPKKEVDAEILATSGLKVEKTPDQHPDYNAEEWRKVQASDPQGYWSSVP